MVIDIEAFNNSLDEEKEDCVIENENTYKYQGMQKGLRTYIFQY